MAGLQALRSFAVKSKIGTPPEFRIARHVSTKRPSAPRLGSVRVMWLPDAACSSVHVVSSGRHCFAWPKSGALGIDPRDFPLHAFPVLGVNRRLERQPKPERRGRLRHSEKIEWHFFVDSPPCQAATRGFYLGIYHKLTQEPNFTYLIEVFLWRRTGYGGFV
jgi:hypothetical protein